MEPILITILIPTYNRGSFLPATLQSVVDQKYQNWECLIIDDGSTDNTKEVVKSFNDPRIKYYYKRNEERSIARNFGIERANGQYVCFLDSDDLYHPNHLSSLIAEIEKENYPVALLNTGMNEKRGDEIIKRPLYKESDFPHPIYFIWEKFMLPSSVCVHKKILGHNKFPTKFNVWEDTHLWLRIVAQYPFYQIEEVTAQWNIHEGGTVEKAFKNVKSAHVINYLKCISHLFKHYREIIQPYLDEREMKAYQLKKLKMFLGISFNRKQYFTFFRLYLYGTFNIERARVHQYAKALITGILKQELYALKARVK